MLITVNNKLHLIDKMSYLPGLCYLMLIGGVPTIHLYNPAVIATGLLIVGFMQLIESFDNERLSYRYFTAPIFIAAACFFYRYMYIYMLAVWFACLFYRPGYWREWVFSVLGFALPVFFAFCWFFLVKDDPTFLTVFFKEIFSAEHLSPNLSVSTVIFFGLAVILIIVTFGHLMRYIGSKKIVIRNGYYCIILIAIITLALSVIVPDTLPATWYLTAFPFSFVLSHYLATVRSVRWGTIVLTLLFIGVITAQMIYLGQFF